MLANTNFHDSLYYPKYSLFDLLVAILPLQNLLIDYGLYAHNLINQFLLQPHVDNLYSIILHYIFTFLTGLNRLYSTIFKGIFRDYIWDILICLNS